MLGIASSYSRTPIDIGTCMFTRYPRFCLLALWLLFVSLLKLGLETLLVLRESFLWLILRIEDGILCFDTSLALISGLLTSFPKLWWDVNSTCLLYCLWWVLCVLSFSYSFLFNNKADKSSSSLMLLYDSAIDIEYKLSRWPLVKLLLVLRLLLLLFELL